MSKVEFSDEENARLEALLIQGLESGPGIEVTPEFWEELRAEAKAIADLHRLRRGVPKPNK